MSSRRSFLPKSRRIKLVLLAGMVALPALILAATGVGLSLRVARDVENESARYNTYIAEKVGEAYDRELLRELREAIKPAEDAARVSGDPAAILRALASQSRMFEAAHYVPLDDLENYQPAMVDGTMIVFGDDPTGRHQHPFAALVLNGPGAEPIGAGGWWFNPRAFLATNLQSVVRDGLPATPRLYGDFESTRHLCVQLLDAQGHQVAMTREMGNPHTTGRAAMSGIF